MILAALQMGDLPPWLAVGAFLIAAWYFRKGGGGDALAILERANHVLSEENKRLHEQNTELAKTRTLEPIIAEVIRQFVSYEERADLRMAHHEEQAAQRSKSHLDVLNLIADRLGPDKEEA